MEYFDLTTFEGGKGKNPRATRKYPNKSPKRPKQTKGARSSSFTTSGQEKASKGLEQRIGNVSPNEENLEQETEQETEQKNHNNKAENIAEQHLNKRALKEEKQAQRRKEEREFMHKYFGIAKSIQKVTNAQRNRANKEKAEQINAIGEKIETKRLSIPQKAYEQALGALESAEAAYEDALRDKILEQVANSVSAGPISQSVGIAIGGPGAPTGGPAGPVGTSSAVIDKAVFDRAFANALNANKNKLYDLTYEIAESYRAMLEKALRGANEEDIQRAIKNIAVFLQLTKIDTEKYEEVLDNLKDACSSIDTIFLTLRYHFRQNNTDKLSGYLSDLEEIYGVIESIDNFPKVLLMSLSVEINNLKDLTEFDIPAKENKNYGEKMEEYSDILNIVYTINTELLGQLNVFQIMKKHFDINNLVKKLKEKIFRLNYLVEETTKIIKEYLKYDYDSGDERLTIILKSKEEIRVLKEEIDEIKGVLSEEGVTREVLNKEYGVKPTKSIDILTPESLRVLKKSTKEVKNRDKKIDELKEIQEKLHRIDDEIYYENNNKKRNNLWKEKSRLDQKIFQLDAELYGYDNSIYKQKLNAIFASNLNNLENKSKKRQKEQKDMGHRLPYFALMRKQNEWKTSTSKKGKKRRNQQSVEELTPINKMKNSEKKELYDLVKASALYRLIFENKPIETNEEKNELKAIGALDAHNSLSDKFEKSFKAEWEKLEKWYKKYQERENELKTRKILSPNTNVRTPIEKEKGIEKLKLTQLDAPTMKTLIKKIHKVVENDPAIAKKLKNIKEVEEMSLTDLKEYENKVKGYMANYVEKKLKKEQNMKNRIKEIYKVIEKDREIAAKLKNIEKIKKMKLNELEEYLKTLKGYKMNYLNKKKKEYENELKSKEEEAEAKGKLNEKKKSVEEKVKKAEKQLINEQLQKIEKELQKDSANIESLKKQLQNIKPKLHPLVISDYERKIAIAKKKKERLVISNTNFKIIKKTDMNKKYDKLLEVVKIISENGEITIDKLKKLISNQDQNEVVSFLYKLFFGDFKTQNINQEGFDRYMEELESFMNKKLPSKKENTIVRYLFFIIIRKYISLLNDEEKLNISKKFNENIELIYKTKKEKIPTWITGLTTLLFPSTSRGGSPQLRAIQEKFNLFHANVSKYLQNKNGKAPTAAQVNREIAKRVQNL